MAIEIVKDQAPLVGVVICCTSIAPEARHLIATAVEEMGATHKFDLTSDVTHLVIGDVDTPKYKYVAKERPDVKVVLPSFVDAVRQVWIEGGDVNLKALETEHRAPALMDLKVCLTGFESTSTRENIRAAVVSNGADFHGDLTKAVTHLVAAAPEGKKYEHARRWNIKVVAFEWLQDSVKRGMALEESLYDPILAPQDRGRNAYNKTAVENVTLGKRQREEEKAPEPAARRKLRRTMSKKMESQQEAIWANIASAGSGQARQDEWQPPEVDSVLGILPRERGSADLTPEATVEPTRRKPSALAAERPRSRTAASSIFQDSIVYIHGFTQENRFTAEKIGKMHSILEDNGARLYSSATSFQAEVDQSEDGYVVVPAEILQEKLPPIPSSAANLQRVTEWWVESCYDHKRLLDPDTHFLVKPFRKFRVQGFEGLTICSTGFPGFDLLHVSKVVGLMGAKYSEYLMAGIDVIVFNTSSSINKEKLDFAAEINVPAVNENWLIESIECGIKQEPADYLIKTETPTVPVDYEPTKPKTNGPKPSLKSRTLQLDFQAPLLDKQKAPAKTNAANKSRMKPKRKGPFFEDDEDEMVTKPPKDTSRWSREPSKRPPSQPLSELSQEQQNSNRHGSQPSQRSQVRDKDAGSQSLPQNENFDTSSAAVHLVDAAKTAAAHTSQTTAPGGDTSQQKEYLNNAIAHLLAAKEAAARRFVSETSARNDSSDQFGRRRRGPLGRAPSCGSFGSMRADSVGSNISQDERREQAPLPDPSQKIIYEDEKAQEERRALIRKMGGHVDAHEEVKRRAESIGVVKDAVSAIGVAGGRGKRRDGGSRTR